MVGSVGPLVGLAQPGGRLAESGRPGARGPGPLGRFGPCSARFGEDFLYSHQGHALRARRPSGPAAGLGCAKARKSSQRILMGAA